MNIYEMHVGVMVAIDKIASNLRGNLLAEEIDFYLNRAVTAFCRASWENPDSRREDLVHTLLLSGELSFFPSTDWPGAAVAGLPGDLILAGETAQLVYDGSSYVAVRTDVNTLRLNLPSKTNSHPLIRRPQFAISDSRLVAGPSPDSPSVLPATGRLTYMRRPATLSRSGGISCDLPETAHPLIVNQAVEQILADLKTLRPTGDNPPTP